MRNKKGGVRQVEEIKKEPCKSKVQKIKNALTRKGYRNDDERLDDAQVYIWISIAVICISLITFLSERSEQ
nr:MAG TPA: hypothetical protein [Caudoviricetes sp.]